MGATLPSTAIIAPNMKPEPYGATKAMRPAISPT
jgi:hypothetical protein